MEDVADQTPLRPAHPDPAALDAAWQKTAAPFLRRTLIATTITLLLISLTLAVYAGPGLAGRYLAIGFWSLVFFGLTPLMLRTMMIPGHRALGLGLVGLKIVWLVILFMICKYWVLRTGLGRAHAAVVIGGLLTPLAVAALRLMGAGSQTKARSPRSISSTDSNS